MGLSKKLGGAAAAAGVSGGAGGAGGVGGAGGGGGWAGPDANYTWSTQAYSLREILTRFRLPCVVQCQGQGESTTVYWEPSHFRFELRQPLLLHAARAVRKVHARSLRARRGGDPAIQLQSEQQQQQPGQHHQQPQQSPALPRSAGDLLEEFGPPLAIPEDYDGWFYPIGRHNSHTATVHTLPRHNKVEGAAAAGPRQFLVTTPLPAFKAVAGSGGNKYVPHEVGVGEVLTKVGIMKGEPSLSAGSGIASVPSTLIPRSKQSLRCLDENRQEVIIPFSQRSLLYDVAENYSLPPANAQRPGGGDSEKGGISLPGVVHTRTIVEVGNSSLPRIFKHVLGEPPALAEAFSGVLRCYSVFTEETVLAAAMCRSSFSSTALSAISSTSAAFSSCLELATNSTAKFNIALNGTELKKTAQYVLALKTCEEQAPTFVRAIKVAFTVNPVSPAANSAVEQTFSGAGDLDVGEQLASVALKLQDEQEVTQTKNITFSGPNKDSNQGEGGQRESDSTDTDEILTDSASVSDATEGAEMFDGSSVSDTAEVDANSEFDISWGQLKRAQSFEGSLSSLETDSGTRSSCSISECSDCDSVLAGSVIAATRRQVSNQSDASVNKESLSHNKKRMDQRASAPSPIYVNIQKKGLSIFNTSSGNEELQNTLTEAENVNSSTVVCNSEDGRLRGTDETSRTDKHPNELETSSERSCSPNSSISSVLQSSLGRISSVLLRVGDSNSLCQQFEEPGQHSELTSEDSSVRSILSISPTLSEIQHSDTESQSSGHAAERMRGEGTAVSNNALVYQDARGQNSKISQQTLKADGEIGTTQTPPLSQNIRMQPTKFADRFNLLQSEQFGAQQSPLPSHAQISPHSSILSLSSCSSSMSTLNSHTDLSSRSSVQSEGTTQDLAIQRLEMAMNEASNFLKSSLPPSAESVEGMGFFKGNSPLANSPSLNKVPSQAQQDTQSVSRISTAQNSDPHVLQQGSLSSSKYSKTGQILGQLSSQSKLQQPHDGLMTKDTRLSGGGVSPSNYPPVASSRSSNAFKTSVLSTGADSTTFEGKLSAAQPKASLAFVAAKPNLGSTKHSVYRLSTHQSDSQLGSSSEKLTEAKEAKLSPGNSGHNADKSASGHEESQTDHDFVKTLGDRLSSVSRLSSLPRYQRLQADSDAGDDSSCDSQYEVTPRLLSTASSDSSLAGETVPVVMIDWDDRQDEVVV